MLFGLSSLLLLKEKSLIWVVVIALFGLSLGIYRGEQFSFRYDKYEAIYDQKVVLIGQAKTDGVYDDRRQLEFEMGEVYVEELDENLPGKINVSGFGAPAINRTDKVRVEGKIYKTLGGKVARVSYAKLEVIQHNNSAVEKFRQNFVAGMYNALPEPVASFGLGLLIGQRSTLPKEVDEDLKKSGLVHIVAVSGYNLTILVLFARRLLDKSSKYQATLLSGLLIVGFLLVTGFSASIVRASIVSGLSLFAWYYGRNFRPLLLIGLSAVITGMVNPIYVWIDIGWYLSFLAFFGVLVLSPLLLKRYSKKPRLKEYKQLVGDTLSAQIMTMPIIMFIFGRVSAVGVLANLIVVPLVPFAMFFSFVAGIAGMIVPSISGIFAFPAKVLLFAILDVAHIFAEIPNALVSVKISMQEMLLLYFLILCLCWMLYHKTRGQRDIIDEDINI